MMDRAYDQEFSGERFEHTIEVKVTTQFPKPDIDQLIQQILNEWFVVLRKGLTPWCVSTKLTKWKDTHEPDSDT